MKKWKKMLFLIPVYTLILGLVIAGIWPTVEGHILPLFSKKPQGDSSQTPVIIEGIEPKNVIQIGDTFKCYPDLADGYLLCTVTDVRSVTNESQCPPKDAFGADDVSFSVLGTDGVHCSYPYEEWFTEGGAYDHGLRIVLVDLEVTNINAVAQVSDGTKFNNIGFYLDNDAFPANLFVDTAYMAKAYETLDGRQVVSYGSQLVYYSHAGSYVPSKEGWMCGQKRDAVQIPIGQTVRFTLGYSIYQDSSGTPADLSKLWLSVMPGRNIMNEGLLDLETSVFIDTKLGSDDQ